jgi:hypothetical protein
MRVALNGLLSSQRGVNGFFPLISSFSFIFVPQLFLYLICCGVILFASAILPFSIWRNGEAFDEDGEANFGKTMDIVCTAFIWLRSIGFAVIISALFAKTYRINKVRRKIKNELYLR